MKTRDKNAFHAHFIIATILFSLAFTIVIGFWTPANQKEVQRVSAALQEQRRGVHRDLAELSSLVDRLDASEGVERVELMAAAVAILRDTVQAHRNADEADLFPLLERTPKAVAGFRYEHGIMESWIDELDALATEPFPDVRGFFVRGERLLGLLEAHLEVEEVVLLGMARQARMD